MIPEGRKYDLVHTLMDNLLDDRIEMYGVLNTISYLMEMGCTKEDLLWLNFEERDIEAAADYNGEEDNF